MKQDFLTLKNLSHQDAQNLVALAIDINKNFGKYRNKFVDKTVGIYFKVPSTRTRTAFTVGAQKLGAAVIAYGPSDLQLNTGETLHDTGRVLANFLDALVVRSNEKIEDMQALASQDSMAVINAMSDFEHPSQVVGDMVAIDEALGKYQNIHIAYYGEGNNTTTALALMASKLGNIHLSLFTPKDYSLPLEFLSDCQKIAAQNNSKIEQFFDAKIIPQNVDVIYTTRWETMGVKRADPKWKDAFVPFQVNQKLLDQIIAASKNKIIFMHDLPAVRGGDTDSEVLDGKNSIAFEQAYHKLTGAMAVYNWIWR